MLLKNRLSVPNKTPRKAELGPRVVFCPSMARMGKKRPAGQIRPAEVFCPSSGGYFSTDKIMFHVKMSFSVLHFSKVWPKGNNIFFKGPRTKKITHSWSMAYIGLHRLILYYINIDIKRI